MLNRLNRPVPSIDGIGFGNVAPAPELADWIKATFLDEGGPLENSEHAHLQNAHIGALWHASALIKNGRQVIGRCELVTLTGDAWAQARKEQQIKGWFGDVPDFIISVDAEWWLAASDAEACALSEHELSHAAQATDALGLPKFTKDGDPAYAIRGHDVEEFVGVVRRYGAGAAGVAKLVAAANEAPLMSADLVGWACGTCGKHS
jgi:hypothetical protein